MIIYIDNEYKCYTSDNGALTAVETDFFNGKCETYIEGYRFVPSDKTWVREDGIIFSGEMIAPWKPYTELAAVQAEYERNQEVIAELDAALLEATYNNLIGGV